MYLIRLGNLATKIVVIRLYFKIYNVLKLYKKYII